MAVIDRLNVNYTPAFLKDGVFDISEYNNGAVYTDLSDALGQNGINIPPTIKKGGMSVKFIKSNDDDNNYVQYTYLCNDITGFLNIDNWECTSPTFINIKKSNNDFSICDEDSNAIVIFKNGEFETKKFHSNKTSYSENIGNENIDFGISDENNNFILEVYGGGHLKTKLFDSADLLNRKFTSFSIIGDSYSTFTGFTDPIANAQWYPETALTRGNDVQQLEDTWWYKFGYEFKMTLVQNNSYSGSTICYDGYQEGHDSSASTESFCKRVEQMILPSNLFIIFGGTNDSWAGSAIGNYIYSNWTEEDKSYYRPALAYLINYIMQHHIGSQIIFILNTGLSNDISESTVTICEHYDVPLLELNNINKIGSHPSKAGMISIKNQLINFLKSI